MTAGVEGDLQAYFQNGRDKLAECQRKKGLKNKNNPTLDTLRARHAFTTAEIRKNSINQNGKMLSSKLR